jgi:tRNA(Ile)-lysidine synthase
MNKFASSPVTKAFQKQKKAFLPDFKGKVVAGVSGGPDSMALLYLLHRHEVDTVAVHINYRLRGEASDKDQLLVEDISAMWNLECASIRLDPEEAEKKNFQAWARDRRYQIFRDIKREYSADYILTAHHEDDQLETILQKMMRGAGLSAWKGMDLLDGDLFRPLLEVSKKEILQFIQDFHIPFRMDRTNEESTYARNFIRNNWFPELNRLFPGWKSNLLRIPDRANEFSLMADLLLEQTRDSSGGLDRQKFLALPPEIRPVIFQRHTEHSGLDVNLSRNFLEKLDSLDTLQTGKSISLSGNLYLLRDRNSFKINEDQAGDHSLTITLDEEDLGNERDYGFLMIQFAEPPETFFDNQLVLDVQPLQFPLTLRRWKDGDLFRPFGMKGSQLVSDHLTNRKVSSAQKKEAKVLESFDGTICAVIFPPHSGAESLGTISERVRCTPETRKTLIIRKK